MKFRVFDKNLKEKMIYLDQHDELKLVFYSDGTWAVLDENGTIITSNGGHGGKLMMGIDYKDKKGKEIYEGDIVHVEAVAYGININAVIIWKNGGFMLKWVCGYMSYIQYWAKQLTESEVIGNIYENPELLESDKK